ncbi:MAG: lysophospholipase, partial [Propionibacteriaceae bacterium]|jgi:lysophospholipase|nr:lysophospholipase [Propionibacteriaceae bacterium]
LLGPFPVVGDPQTYVANELGAGVCSDPAVVEKYNADPLVEKQISVGLMQSFEGGINYLKQNAAQFTAPALILHGLQDGLVSPLDSMQMLQEIGSVDRSLRIYSGMMHEIFNEFDKDLVIADVLNWLNARVK